MESVSAPGIIGSKLVLFSATVTDDDIVAGAGGGLAEEGEDIEVVYVKRGQVDGFLRDPSSMLPASAAAAVSLVLAGGKPAARADDLRRAGAAATTLAAAALAVGVVAGLALSRAFTLRRG
jgi:hypothetical protein